MRRSSAAFLVLVLLCVPSLTRVYQQLDCRSTAATLSSSFSKSIDCPPSKIAVDMLPALTTRVVLTGPAPSLDCTGPVFRVEVVRSIDTSQPESLRAPPIR